MEVRNRLDDAKRDDNEETRTTALKNMYREKKQSAQEKAQKADEKVRTILRLFREIVG